MSSQRFVILGVVFCVVTLFGGGMITHSDTSQMASVDDMSQTDIGVDDRVFTASDSATATATTTETITISVNDSSNGEDSTTTPITVETQQSETVPSDFPGTDEQYTAIDTNSDGITLGELRTAVDSWSTTGTVGDGVGINLGELRDTVNYWSSTSTRA